MPLWYANTGVNRYAYGDNLGSASSVNVGGVPGGRVAYGNADLHALLMALGCPWTLSVGLAFGVAQRMGHGVQKWPLVTGQRCPAGNIPSVGARGLLAGRF